MHAGGARPDPGNDSMQALWVRMQVALGERGTSLVEYALLVALVALIVVVALQIVGDELSRDMRRVGRALEP